jgi:hypothetical protein
MNTNDWKLVVGLALGIVLLIVFRLIVNALEPTHAEIRQALLDGEIDEDYALELMKRARK